MASTHSTHSAEKHHDEKTGHPIAQHPNYSTVLHFLDESLHHLAYSKSRLHHFFPRFDVEELETSFEVYGELPGARKEDIKIQDLHGYGIEISGDVWRFPHRENYKENGLNGHPELKTETAPEAKGKEIEGPKTNWPEMAEPGMQAAAENGAVMAEAQDTASSAKASEAVVPAPAPAASPEKKEKTKHSEKKKHEHGTMEELPVTYPRTVFHERQIGQFKRTIRFPAPVDTSKVDAELKEGVLRIRVPKDIAKIEELEKEKRRIEVAWADASMWGL